MTAAEDLMMIRTIEPHVKTTHHQVEVVSFLEEVEADHEEEEEEEGMDMADEGDMDKVRETMNDR
jgi:hypothetical protein